MRLDPVRFSMLLIGVSFACYSPSLHSLQEQAYKSAVVIEGKVQSVPVNASREPYSVAVRVLDVWPINSGGLAQQQLVTIGPFGSRGPCVPVLQNHRYIFFMEPTEEPLVFKASYSPLNSTGTSLKKDLGQILCKECASAPKLKQLKNQSVAEGTKLMLKCEATGNPTLSYKWYKDGNEVKESKEVKIKSNKRNSRIQINKAKVEDSGNYTCVVENTLGKGNTTSTINVQSITTTLSPGSGHTRGCNETEKTFCVNGGDCYFIHGINQLSCKCRPGYFGPRCLEIEPMRSYMPKPTEKAEELYQKRVLTITGICVTLLVVGIVCVVAYCKTKKQRKKMHNHLRQNMCADHINRNLANGPNHPGPGPEEIPMVDYISKNVPATERVIRHEAEASFPGSRASSRSHHSSTATHSSSHRHEGRVWSPDRTGSMISGSHSGMMSSSVGTSKCNSPACMEARARRAAHCGVTESQHHTMQYRDSFDSLGDSPHSDRYVSALTTPARLSPVDFHYSLPPQVPTFQITSPNASHAASLLPATRNTPYRLKEEQRPAPSRRYQVHEPYRQHRRTYLNDSTGSLPSSPYRAAEDEEYETTQEYLSSRLPPKRSGRRWWRPGAHGQDYGSRGCLSESESEDEQGGESTPFLSMQNMSVEPTTVCKPADGRTIHTQASAQSRPGHARPKQDHAAL